VSSQLPPEVVEALRRGNPLEAIKLMRRANPKMGLAEAKRFLEAVQKMGPSVAAAAAAKAQARPSSSTPHTPPPRIPIPYHKPSVSPTFERTGLSPGEQPRATAESGAIALLVVVVMTVLLWVKFG
jgi:hypothetical protein